MAILIHNIFRGRAILLVTLTILYLFPSCTSERPREPENRVDHTNAVSSCPRGVGHSMNLTECPDRAGDKPFESQESLEDVVPNFKSTRLGSRFNRKSLETSTIPDEYQKIKIFAKTVGYYRGIWLDLKKTGGTGKKLSIWQPLQSPTILPFSPTSPLEFFLAGHLASSGLKHPLVKTVVLSPNLFMQGNEKVIGPPEDYELIYRQSGEYTQDTLKMCEEMQKGLISGDILMPKIEDQTYCDNIIPGTLEGSYNPYTGTYNNAFEELFKKQSVAIWNPIPKDGYKCLGQISTNGQMEKPYTEKDFSQSRITINYSDRYAMYCVKEEYVSEGRLEQPPLWADGDIAVFRIVAKDPEEGFSDANLFYAIKGNSAAGDLSDIKVWTLKKKYVKFLEDDVDALLGTPP